MYSRLWLTSVVGAGAGRPHRRSMGPSSSLGFGCSWKESQSAIALNWVSCFSAWTCCIAFWTFGCSWAGLWIHFPAAVFCHSEGSILADPGLSIFESGAFLFLSHLSDPATRQDGGYNFEVCSTRRLESCFYRSALLCTALDISETVHWLLNLLRKEIILNGATLFFDSREKGKKIEEQFLKQAFQYHLHDPRIVDILYPTYQETPAGSFTCTFKMRKFEAVEFDSKTLRLPTSKKFTFS